jgi:tRNA (guanine37-N1)-methyltransferase
MVLICGRYEGVDERVSEHLVTDEISIGDFVLSGGELPAAMILDAVTRLIPGALGNEDSSVNESFSDSTREIDLVQENRTRDIRARDASPAIGSEVRITERGILDFPHYTRPQSFRGWNVPEVLISGNHEEIRRWRAERALDKTLRNRPDLLERLRSSI